MSEFDKWWEENCMNVSANRTEAEDIYNLGVESQQTKIDNLQKENDRLNTWYKNVKLQLENKQIDCDRSDKELEELRARVGEALKHVVDHGGYDDLTHVINILKGNKDEN